MRWIVLCLMALFLTGCDQRGSASSSSDKVLLDFVRNRDDLIAKRSVQALRETSIPDAAVTIRNPYINQMAEGAEDPSDELKARWAKIETKGETSVLTNYYDMLSNPDIGYVMIRRDIAAVASDSSGRYNVQSKTTEIFCAHIGKNCTKVVSDDVLVISLVGDRPQIVSESSLVTELPERTGE